MSNIVKPVSIGIVHPIVSPVEPYEYLGVAINSTLTNRYTTWTNETEFGFNATLSSGVGFGGWNIDGNAGEELEVIFNLKINSGSPAVALRQEKIGVGTTSASTAQIITTSGFKRLTITAGGNFQSITFSETDVPSDFEVRDFYIIRK